VLRHELLNDIADRRLRSQFPMLSPGAPLGTYNPTVYFRRSPLKPYSITHVFVPLGRMRRNNPSPSPTSRSWALLGFAVSHDTAASLPMAVLLGGNLGGVIERILVSWVGLSRIAKTPRVLQVTILQDINGYHRTLPDDLCATG
jgi:hypothetical protein